MGQRLKRWESPRREGRNDKGKGGSARQRQKRKQLKMLCQKLKTSPQRHQNYRVYYAKICQEGNSTLLFYWLLLHGYSCMATPTWLQQRRLGAQAWAKNSKY